MNRIEEPTIDRTGEETGNQNQNSKKRFETRLRIQHIVPMKKRENSVSLSLSLSFISIFQQDKKVSCQPVQCSCSVHWVCMHCSVCQNWATVRVNRPRGELISPPARVSMPNPILLSNELLLIRQAANRSNISE